MSSQPSAIPAISGGGEMGALIRAYPWEKTSLGSPETWPQSLQTCLRIMLTSSQPIWIGWGKDLIKFYNDPYKQIVGGKHPWALGQPAAEVWRDIWSDIGPMLDKVMYHDRGSYVESQLLIMERNGYPEETYYTFSYTPIPGDDGQTEGMFCANTDDTERVISERQLKTLTELGKVLINATTHHEVLRASIAILGENPKDFPFALFRTIEGNRALLSESTELGEALSIVQQEINLDEENKFAVILNKALAERKMQVVDNVRERFGILPSGSWPTSPDRILVIPVTSSGSDEAFGMLVVGVNPYRLFDGKYQSFYQLVADQIVASLTQVQALEAERRRAAALAEIDKAKTVFFSNISHEFRTPITLMLGTIEAAIEDEATTPANQQRLEVAYRNAMRVLKLVNNLLDFSRIEAGRIQASFQPTDIVEFTRDLASGFRSIMENAGLQYNWEAETIEEPVYVDKLMWEKIVLNLISNAFKYTLEGEVSLKLYQEAGQLVFEVHDTGLGIPADEIPRMFERFHRVQNVTGRTYEGTGIGLSLVNELVQLHGGVISVESEIGKGSVFQVRIPLGKHHLPPEQIDDRDLYYETAQSQAFLEEAEGLVEEELVNPENGAPAEKSSIVLVVDDNPDMRNYLRSILGRHFMVYTASNGLEALELLENYTVQLVLSDIMMPELDGIGLLKRIKQEKRWSSIPVILVSARAGEDEKIEGYEIGADDYLVKPFSARELVSRVKSHLSLAIQRRKEENKLRQLVKQAPVGMCVLRGENFITEVVNDRMLEILGRAEGELLDRPIIDVIPEARPLGYDELLRKVFTTGEAFVGNEHHIVMERFGKKDEIFVNFVFEPLRENNGEVAGIVVVATDVSDQMGVRRLVEESEQRFRAMVTATSDVVYRMSADWMQLQELQGRGFLEDTGEPIYNWIDKYAPESVRAEIWKAVNHAIATKSMFQLEHPVIQADGSIGWTYSRAVPILDERGEILEWFGAASDITSRKKVEEQLRITTEELAASKKLYDAISGSTPDLMFVFDMDHRLVYANKAALNMWGKTWEESVGEKLSDLGYESWHAAMHEREMNQVIATKTSIRGEVSFPHAELGKRIYDYIFVPLFNDEGEVISIAGTIRDISDLKQIEQALKQSEEQFRTLTQSLPQLIWTARPDGYCDFFNQQWYDYTGSTPEQSIGDGWARYVAPIHRNQLYNEWQNSLATGSPLLFEFQLTSYTGSLKWFFVIGKPIRDEYGKVTKWVGALTNIEEQKAVEEKLETLVNERTRELKRSNDDLLKFAHVASHDLREPVRKVKTFVSCLEQDPETQLSSRARTYLDKIYSATDRMVYMIEGVLTYSTLTQHDQPFIEVDLNRIIDDIISDQEVLIEQKRARIIHEPLPAVVGAQMLLYQLFYNLINNALKFAKQDQPLVVRISAQLREPDTVSILVQDNGIGFPQSEAERIFGSFTRLHSKDRYAGTGLGLSLCRQIVERHNGTITAESQEGRGSSFLIRLPLHQG